MKLTCIEVAQAALGPPAKRSGREVLWHCPRHDDQHASLCVNPAKDVWMCGPCGKSGNWWQLAAFLAGASPDAKATVTARLRQWGILSKSGRRHPSLGGEGYVNPSPGSATPQHAQGLTLEQYATAKNLPIAFLRELRLSTVYLGGQAAVRIPYMGLDGFEGAIRFRMAMHGEERFRWKTGSKSLLYGLWKIREAEAAGFVCLVEGESDCQTLWHHGFPALGFPGAGSWREEWASFLEGVPTVYILIEPDRGGDAVRKWLASSNIRQRAKLITLEGAKDPSALHLANPEDFCRCWNEALERARPWSDLERAEAERHAAAALSRCVSLAKSPDILSRLTLVLRNYGVVGEERITKLVYLCVTSRLLEKPLSIAVKGPSSGGKSFLVERVLELFPMTAYYALTAMSERALAYSEEPMKHRVLVLYEVAGLSGDFASYLLRSLLSEGKLRYETVEKTKAGMRPRLIEREGPTGLIVTTTAVQLHPENETRLLSVTVNDSQEQTKAVLSALAEEVERGQREGVPEEWHALQEWLLSAEHRVKIPYAKKLAEAVPPVAVRLRRDLNAIFNLIRAHAVLHQASRERDASGRIVATLADYAAIRDLVADLVSERVELTVSKAVRQTLEAVKELCDRGNAPEISVSQLALHLKLDRATVSRRVKVALERGSLRNLEDKRGQPFRLVLGDPLPGDSELLPKPERLACCSLVGDSGGMIGDYAPRSEAVPETRAEIPLEGEL